MKSLIRWAVSNSPAINTLVVGVLVVGAASLWLMRREVFPEFDLEIVVVSVPYPGASPEEVEDGICLKVEEAVRSIDGIKRQTSVAQEGAGFVILELSTSADTQRVLAEVRSQVDRISTFPELAEDSEVEQVTIRYPAILLGVLGPGDVSPEAELQLREVSEQVRDELLQLPTVSQANIVGAKPYQIDIEIGEQTLRQYGLTLEQVAAIVRRENLEMPGGSMKTATQEVLLRGKNKQIVGEEIANIPLLTEPGGTVLTVGDLATVRDEFEDVTSLTRIDGRPGMVISVNRTATEDLLAITGEVKQYASAAVLPPGYEVTTWADRSVDVRDRMDLLVRNGVQGLILVFLCLAIFLELRLAFWVAMGIPISMLGASAVLLAAGHTLNMLTMFAYLMALGMVVDDAIVVGENIHSYRMRGMNPIEAAVKGAVEVIPSITSSVLTTVIAFLPLAFVSGVMGKFIAVLPITVIAILFISLAEATFSLPCHLAHVPKKPFDADVLVGQARRVRNKLPPLLRYTLGSMALAVVFLVAQLLYPLQRLGALFGWIGKKTDAGLNRFLQRRYLPVLRWSLANPVFILALCISLLLLTAGMIRGGVTPFNLFPKIDITLIEAKIVYPEGTAESVTDRATERLEEAIRAVNEERSPDGTSMLKLVHRTVGSMTSPGTLGPENLVSGSNVGYVSAELVDTSQRELHSQEILNLWRAKAGEFAGAESLVFGSPDMGPGGAPIEFKLLAPPERMAELEQLVEHCKTRLDAYQGVFDIRDDSRPGKWEFQLRVKDQAVAMGIPLADLAQTVRSAYYGAEVMRLQRGRHEVKLMVRYPREDRRSLADFENLRVRTGDGAERPLTELAEVEARRGYAEINRVEQQRSITITADVNEEVLRDNNTSSGGIVSDFKQNVLADLLVQHPWLNIRWEGQQEQSNESISSLIKGFSVALLAMFVLLTMEFRSYVQPLLILVIIPFGAAGAIWGHAVMGLEVTLFSLFGLVALAGVVVNDSIVLIDFINHRRADGIPLEQALVDAGLGRFRAVMLTSLTTIAGLFPLVTERSFQAQILIPMATSLCFGLLVSMLLVLVMVPTLYMLGSKLGAMMATAVAEEQQQREAVG